MLSVFQVEAETTTRKEAEAACLQMETLLERMSQKLAEEKVALDEKERMLLSQVEQERKEMAQSVNECDRKLAETRKCFIAVMNMCVCVC